MATTVSASFKAATGGAESEAEAVLLNRLRQLNLPPFETQVLLIEGRRLRFDAVFGEPYYVAIELQGGMWKKGAHNRAAGIERDSVKSALAQIAGYISLAFTPAQVQSGVAGLLIMEALKARGWKPDSRRVTG